MNTEEKTITLEELPVERLDEFWAIHLPYLIDDGIIDDEEDIEYFSGEEYRGILREHMLREKDKQRFAYFIENGERIGAVSYCIYESEDGKCFMLDFWVFDEFRGNGTGRRCFEAFEAHAKAQGAVCFELNSTKPDSVRFWKSLGFTENGADEWDMPLYIKN